METERLIELVVMARQGDADAMQTLYLDAYRSVYYLALRMVKNPEDAEDITQDVFITVQEKISELREPAAFYKWVNQITVNKCNYLLRKYKGITRLDDGDEILALVDDNPLNLPDKAIDDEATRKIILDVIDGLPDGQRVCVMLYYYQQNTISQIADMLETNENTVKTRLSLARAKIRSALEEKEKKEGIKLYGIPLALTPILRQAMEQFTVPEGVAERMWENIQKATSGGTPTNGGPGADQPGGHGTSGQNVPKSETGGGSGISGAASQAATGAVMTLATKIIIGIIAAAVVTAGAIIIPRLLDSPPEETPPPVVTDAATIAPDDTRGQTVDTESSVPIAADYAAAYKQVLLDNRDAILGAGLRGYEDFGLVGEGDVNVTDINGDGIPELLFTLIRDSSSPAEDLHIYSYVGGSALRILTMEVIRDDDEYDPFVEVLLSPDGVVMTARTIGTYHYGEEYYDGTFTTYEFDSSGMLVARDSITKDSDNELTPRLGVLTYYRNGEVISESEHNQLLTAYTNSSNEVILFTHRASGPYIMSLEKAIDYLDSLGT